MQGGNKNKNMTFSKIDLFRTLLSPLGWVSVMIQGQYRYLRTHGVVLLGPCSPSHAPPPQKKPQNCCCSGDLL